MTSTRERVERIPGFVFVLCLLSGGVLSVPLAVFAQEKKSDVREFPYTASIDEKVVSESDQDAGNKEVPSPDSENQADPGQDDVEPQEERIPGGINGFISLDLRDIDLIDALKFFSQRVGIDIVTTKAVGGRITLMVEDVPVKDVFDIMLRSNKLAYDQRGDIYNVMTEDEYRVIYGKPFSDMRQVQIFRLQYAIPEQAFSLLDTLKSDIGRVLVDPESGNALVIDIPEKTQAMRKALEAFEQKNDVRVFPLQYAKAKDVEEQLKTQIDAKKLGVTKADERGNQVIVQTLPDRMKEVERIVRELDSKTKEVLIETTIIKLKITDETTKGVQWEGLFDTALKQKGLLYVGSSPFASVQSATDGFRSRKETLADVGYVGSYPFSGTTSALASSTPAVGTEVLHVGIIGAQDTDVILKYVQALGSTKILANPKIVVTNNQESRIHVGERQAYVTTTTTTGQVTSTVAEDVTFVDVGIQLAVTPVINDDGYVTMKVKAEISSVTSTLVTPTQNRIPIIDTSLAETTVMAKEGTTIVMGGLKRDERTETGKQTPFLSKIPLIGEFFKSGTNKTDRTELIILMTPRIISGDALVTQAGLKVEDSRIKGRQEYQSFKSYPAQNRPLVSASDALDGKKIIFKGLRVAE